MCREEGVNLQRGMNFHLRDSSSVILMSLRKGAPYADRIEEDGRVLIYEGHDIPRATPCRTPRSSTNRCTRRTEGLTQNGLFHKAAKQHADDGKEAEQVRVYEKIRTGIWVFTGTFRLLDAWDEPSGSRQVFKFRLELDATATTPAVHDPRETELDQTRLIPTTVKLEVWKRDAGKCVECGSTDNLHF